MELTLDAALSPSGLMGHAGYLLLVCSMLLRSMVLLRVLVIASALVGIVYSGAILGDPVGVFWESLLVTVNVVQLAITAWLNRRARFTAEERAFVRACFPGVPAGQQRALLDLGQWESGVAGRVLCTEGAPVPRLCYIASGRAAVTVGGRHVADCVAGDYVGEITIASGAPASGTVILSDPARLWSISAEDLRQTLDRKPELGRALEASFFRAVRDKLIQSNRRGPLPADLAAG